MRHIPQKELDFKIPHIMHDGAIPNKYPGEHAREVDGLPILWKENKSFEAAFEFINIWTRQNEVYIRLKNTATGIVRCMLNDDFEKLIKSVPAVNGIFVGNWRFRKRKDKSELTVVLDE